MVRKKNLYKELGKCQFCGKPIYEFPFGWGCSGDCGAIIYSDSKYFLGMFNKKPTKSQAVRLLTGESVILRNQKIAGGEAHDVELRFDYSKTGEYKYHYFLTYLDKKKEDAFKEKKEEQVITGFDILNE